MNCASWKKKCRCLFGTSSPPSNALCAVYSNFNSYIPNGIPFSSIFMQNNRSSPWSIISKRLFTQIRSVYNSNQIHFRLEFSPCKYEAIETQNWFGYASTSLSLKFVCLHRWVLDCADLNTQITLPRTATVINSAEKTLEQHSLYACTLHAIAGKWGQSH